MTANVEAKLNTYFALMACLCGLTFVGAPELGAWAFVAVFFAVFGLVFVDWLKWFSLPPTMAYLALGGIAFYTLNRFMTIGVLPAEPQMEVVAELLILVQAVLMLQRKSRRTYEQLAVFAMLELIVSAIFNNALSYGLLLIPLGAVSVGALSLLHVITTSEDAFANHEVAQTGLRVSAAESRRSFLDAAAPVPRIGMLTIAPAVAVVAMVFFYALPRTNQEARRGLGGQAQVGFNDEVRLGQIGKMLLNPVIAARIQITNRNDGRRYDVVGDFYLRGAVLENYNAGGALEGTWGATKTDLQMGPRQLPSPPNQLSNRLSADEVSVHISVSPMDSESLFSLPPYAFDASGPEIVHLSDRWLIARRTRAITNRDSQISYQFSSYAFRGGIQNRFLPRFSTTERLELVEPVGGTVGDSIEQGLIRAQQIDHEQSAVEYVANCLAYDIDHVPSAERLATSIVATEVRDPTNGVEVAKALERALADGNRYEYTLDLTKAPVIGLDPIEQFLSVDRSGNCQYFASALVLMLRSQGIPARLVVGFNTDEFNNIGGFYVARQLHAHAWVEALVNADLLKPNELQYSAVPAKQYWMRLDPTPGGGGTNMSVGGRMSNVLELAQDIWTSYVVDADANDRRRETGIGSDEMSGSYQLYYEWLKLKVSRIRAGELGAGALAGRDLFSWPSAILGIILSLAAVAIYQWGLPSWLIGPKTSAVDQAVALPSIAFFAEALALLKALGFQRRSAQTPQEFMADTANELQRAETVPLSAPLLELTSAFYTERFGPGTLNEPVDTSETTDRKIIMALELIRARVDDELRSRD